MKDSNGSIQRWAKALGFFTLILAELLGSIGAGVIVGYLAWQKLGAPGWVVLVGTFIGLGIATVRLYKFWQREDGNG